MYDDAPGLFQPFHELPELERRRLLRRLAHFVQSMVLSTKPILAPFSLCAPRPIRGHNARAQSREIVTHTSFLAMTSP